MSSEKYINYRCAADRRIMTISILASSKAKFVMFQLWLKENHPSREWYQGEVMDEIISDSPLWREFLAQEVW
ncbi:hypothetical protein DRN77_05860 [Methanosarcinales archaeon]|nr:MAG: hypothetical protein DRN77_05860 [Methanosarcinales archaeon]